MNSIMDLILIVFTAFIVSIIAATTRGDRKNIKIKAIIGTLLGSIFFIVLRLL